MAITLQNHLNSTMRLLHDSTNKYWTQAELIDYVNESRKWTAAKSKCTRTLAAVNVAAATTLAGATYNFYNSIVAGRQVTDVMDIILQYASNTQIQLVYRPFPDIMRTPVWQYQMTGTPYYYTIHNRKIIILQWPAIAYPGSLFDVVLEPVDLANTTDVDSDIYHPFSSAVPFYAAYLAKMKDQRRQDADNFLRDYYRTLVEAAQTQETRRLVGR